MANKFSKYSLNPAGPTFTSPLLLPYCLPLTDLQFAVIGVEKGITIHEGQTVAASAKVLPPLCARATLCACIGVFSAFRICSSCFSCLRLKVPSFAFVVQILRFFTIWPSDFGTKPKKGQMSN